MASVTVDMQPLPDSTAPKRLCPLKNPVFLDMFTEIIADSSEDTPDSRLMGSRLTNVTFRPFPIHTISSCILVH